jgi:thiol-disulfide isomerase/thioredoxin
MTLDIKVIIILLCILILIILLIHPYLNKGSYFSATVDKLNNQNNQDIQDNNNTIVLIFFADWCVFCEKAKPTFDKLANDYPNKVQLINDKNKDLLSKYSVKSFPTIMTNTGDTYESNDRSYEALSEFINTY